MKNKKTSRLPTLAGALALGTSIFMAGQAPAATAADPAPVAPMAIPANAAFDRWADQFADEWVRLDPETATFRGYFTGEEGERINRELTPLTQAHRDQVTALAKRGLAAVERFDRATLSPLQQTSVQVLRSSLQDTIRRAPYAMQLDVPFAQISGVHTDLPVFFSSIHPMRTPGDIRSYLMRLRQVSTRIDEAAQLTREAARRGIIPPRFTIDRSLGQFDAFLAPAADQNTFVTTLGRRIDSMGGVDAQVRTEALAEATRIVDSAIKPAYVRARAVLAGLREKAGSEAGIARLPDGAAAYRAALAGHTSGNLTPEQIHAIGLREVARIEGEMDAHLRALGFNDGTIKQRMAALNTSLQPPAGSDPRPAMLERYRDIIADALVRSKALFNIMPTASVEVRREPLLSEASSAAHYTIPAPDGSRPGVFWAPLPGPVFHMVDMRSLAYHEAVPGHHFQLAVMQELKVMPKWRANRVFGGGAAFTEGWALYTERLAIENNWYAGDTVGLLGALDSQLFRARRLVVDTGLHSMGWTREQGIEYGIPEAEVERYVVWPGQACAYMIGMLRIVDLREKAKVALGDKFSLPGFHDVILKNASVPLDVLDRLVDEWVAAEKKRV
jgi:uncharacterized protein (DUF885 family)